MDDTRHDDELGGLLDGTCEPATVEDLEAVVRRAGQRRRARLMAGAAGLLALGAVGGALVRGPAGGDQATGFAAEPQALRQPQVADAAAASLALPDGARGPGGPDKPRPTFTSLFRRDANGIAVRAYRVTFDLSSLPADAPCKPTASIHGALSNAAAIGPAIARDVAGDSFSVLGVGGFGHAEGEPVTWAIVRPGAGMTTVRLKVGAATDSMAPQGGVALLAVPGPAEGAPMDGAVVEGLDGDGKTVASLPLKPSPPPEPDPGCPKPVCGPGGPPPGGMKPGPPPDKAGKPATDLPAVKPPKGDVVKLAPHGAKVECHLGPGRDKPPVAGGNAPAPEAVPAPPAGAPTDVTPAPAPPAPESTTTTAAPTSTVAPDPAP